MTKKRQSRSAETKQKISYALKGNKLSTETKKKISQSLTGKKYPKRSKAHRKKLSESHTITHERILSEIKLLSKQGYRCIPIGHKVTPDIIAIKGKDIEVLAIEVEYGKPNYSKYTKDIHKYYDDVRWLLRSSRLPKILIFEGPDGCGKTEISKAFAKRHIEYARFKLEKEQMYIKQMTNEQIRFMHEVEAEFFLSFAKQVQFNVIFDRNYPSEICYSRAFRTLNENYWKTIDAAYSKLGTKIVICYKSDELLCDDIFKQEQLIVVKQEYLKFAKETNCDILVLDTSDENLKKQLDIIDSFIYC